MHRFKLAVATVGLGVLAASGPAALPAVRQMQKIGNQLQEANMQRLFVWMFSVVAALTVNRSKCAHRVSR